MTLDIGWFSTGRGEGSRKLLGAVYGEIASGRLNARIAVVFCNRAPGEDANTDVFFEQVRDYELPLVTLSSRDFRRKLGEKPVRKGDSLPGWRREFDREVMRRLEPYRFEIGLLAGYMLIFAEEFAQRYDLLNLHPAAPGGPKGVWQDVIWELIESRAERAGIMLHLATSELDEGPPVTFCSYSIRGRQFDELWKALDSRPLEDIKSDEGEGNPLFAAIRRAGLARETPLVVETIRALADGRVSIEDKRVVDGSGSPMAAFDLTAEIESAVARALA
jgi:folate-dependent phosphoribosylglycinamide formyltransferase PurN